MRAVLRSLGLTQIGFSPQVHLSANVFLDNSLTPDVNSLRKKILKKGAHSMVRLIVAARKPNNLPSRSAPLDR